ncbi:transcriptional regulator [Planotetraspora thailandica]|uniref:Transcriptional regulator n=2 Tax=Planotetraspora thailandica TaxID=487172 RepID=A0A8J3XX03_9ACTN|nr:transcriptional regulator [Planotetraspora thailandica]
MLAGVSTDYYIRLEQGRERHPSDQVLGALAQVLQLDDEATAHLHELARPRQPWLMPADRTDRVSPTLLRLMGSWSETPAVVVNRRLDVLARNRLANALYGWLDPSDNMLRLTFLAPEAREFYPDWEKDAASKTAQLRAAADYADPLLIELVKELSQASEDFCRMWARYDVQATTCDTVRFRHPEAGDLTLNYEALTVNSAPSQALFVFQAEPDSPSEAALARLDKISAETE